MTTTPTPGEAYNPDCRNSEHQHASCGGTGPFCWNRHTSQRRHEAPELGDAIVRMMRGLVTRAAEGDTEAIEQLARIEQLAPQATTLSVQLARGAGRHGYSYTQLADVLGVSRQAARQRVERGAGLGQGVGHVLMPGHRKATCGICQLGGAR